MPRPAADLGPILDSLSRRYDRAWLESDPLRWPRAYADPRDREIVAVIAALLAYGRVASIHASIRAVLVALPARPSRSLLRSRRPALRSALAGFRHRFTSGDDLAWVLESLVGVDGGPAVVQNRIVVDEAVAAPARVALERMLAARP